jgi:Flp pilus assembly protein TadD/predicted aspartyl protease
MLPRVAAVVVVSIIAVAVLSAQSPADLTERFNRATSLYRDGKYSDALEAFVQASESLDPSIALGARKGTVLAALRIGEFTLARRTASILSTSDADAEALTLSGDALWAAGFFDEADHQYARALAVDPHSARARYGIARSLSSRSRLTDALSEVERALGFSPADSDLHALHGTVLERLKRFEDAARAYDGSANLLPKRETTAITTARNRATLLRSFSKRPPLDVSDEDANRAHTLPFKLVNNKVVVLGRLNGVQVEWVLDTGAERTGISPELASAAAIRTVTSTLTAGVGRPGVRRIRLGRADSVQLGSLTVRNVPVAIRAPVIGGAARWQAQSLSPIALGFSVKVDYGRKRVVLARALTDPTPDGVTLPMRIQPLPLIRGTLNSMHTAYFVVDTGGEVISIGADTADLLGMESARHIPIRVLGMSGPDENAFLLPGVDLDFEGVSLRRVGLAVLNLRAPSVLLGYQVGGIVGHNFLSRYHVSIDVPRSVVRLEAVHSSQ